MKARMLLALMLLSGCFGAEESEDGEDEPIDQVHELCSCDDQSCLDEWLCPQTGNVPVCVAVHCGPDIYHFCSIECPIEDGYARNPR